MAKYVCDVEQVSSAGDKLCQAASEIKSAVSSYSSKIDGTLSSWSGKAKDSFSNTNAKQVSLANQQAEYLNSLGEFVKNAAQSIESLEGELAGLNI